MPGDVVFFDDLRIGEQWETGSRTITESDITSFAGVSGDFNPIHVDEVYAAETEYGTRIAHGALVLAVATGLRQQQTRFRGSLRAWTGIREWRFRRPVTIGDTIRVRNRVVGLEPSKRRTEGTVDQEIEVLNQRDETVASGTFVTLMRRRDAA